MNLINFESDAAWETRFNEYLQSNSRALDSFRSLIDVGIPESWLLRILHDYADPELRRREQLRQRETALRSLKEIDRVRKSIGNASGALEAFASCDSIPDFVRDNYFNLRRSSFYAA